MSSESLHDHEGISAYLDGELSPDDAARIEAHLTECAPCREYRDGLSAVKRSVTLQPARPIHDRTEQIMMRVRDEHVAARREWRIRRQIGVAAAFVTLVVLAAAAIPRSDGSPGTALADEMSRDIRRAAASLSAYHATYAITERGWHPLVPLRRFTADLWFRAPEDLRLRIEDQTDYPTGSWPTNDVDLVADASTWSVAETTACPTRALPDCGIDPHRERRTVEHRQPFDGATLLPTDIILPLESVAGADGLRVLGSQRVAGRTADHVVLPFWQAKPLVDSIEVAGAWRGFPPEARVDLWLATDSWFPLRFTVTAPTSPQPSLVVAVTQLDEPSDIADRLFRAPDEGLVTDGRFVADDHPDAPQIAGLPLYRHGRVGKSRITAYATGMSWVKVTRAAPARPTLDVLSEDAIQLSGGVGYYRPLSDVLRRRIDIFSPREHLSIETNLPKDALVDIASDEGAEGRTYSKVHVAGGTVSRVDPGEVDGIAGAVEPTYLPTGYRAAAALVTDTRSTQSAALYFRRTEAGADGDEIRVTSSTTTHRLPPSSDDLVAVRTTSLRARWSPARSELEWIDDGVYRAVSVPAFDLDTAIRIAESISS
ncbi:MAG TPA: anti-sigma factor [Actinomycetota bacterium]|nr:anti-sigma factor [Actinomycetota bacterium]